MAKLYEKYLSENENIEFTLEDLSLYVNLIEYGYIIGFNDDKNAEEYFLEDQYAKVVQFIENKIREDITPTEAENIEKIDLTHISVSVNIADEDKYYYKFKRVEYNIVLKDGEAKKEKIHPFITDLIADDLQQYFK